MKNFFNRFIRTVCGTGFIFLTAIGIVYLVKVCNATLPLATGLIGIACDIVAMGVCGAVLFGGEEK